MAIGICIPRAKNNDMVDDFGHVIDLITIQVFNFRMTSMTLHPFDSSQNCFGLFNLFSSASHYGELLCSDGWLPTGLYYRHLYGKTQKHKSTTKFYNSNKMPFDGIKAIVRLHCESRKICHKLSKLPVFNGNSITMGYKLEPFLCALLLELCNFLRCKCNII